MVKEGSAVEEISSRLTVTGILNISCDLYLDHNRAIQSFSQDNPAYNDVPSNQVYLQKDQFRRPSKKSYFDHMIRHCDLDLKDSKPIFLEDNQTHNDASPYQVKRFSVSEYIIWTNIH